MLIGILQAGPLADATVAKHGDYPDLYAHLLRDQGFTFRSFRVVDMAFPDSVTACDGWLISGSRYGAYEDMPFIAPLEQFIRDAMAADVPLVGICFGHQIIAQALGGTVEKVARGWSVGRKVYDFDGTPLAVNAWHQDQVTVLPDGARVVAQTEFCPYAALVYGRAAYSVQPHPEFTGAFTVDLAESRGRGVVPEAILETAIADAGKPLDNAAIADRIGAFFRTRNPSGTAA